MLLCLCPEKHKHCKPQPCQLVGPGLSALNFSQQELGRDGLERYVIFPCDRKENLTQKSLEPHQLAGLQGIRNQKLSVCLEESGPAKLLVIVSSQGPTASKTNSNRMPKSSPHITVSKHAQLCSRQLPSVRKKLQPADTLQENQNPRKKHSEHPENS